MAKAIQTLQHAKWEATLKNLRKTNQTVNAFKGVLRSLIRVISKLDKRVTKLERRR